VSVADYQAGSGVTTVTYEYDVFGNRLSETDTPAAGPAAVTRYAYDGENAWADLGGGGLEARRLYLDGVDQVFARISSGGTAAWYLTDRLGSVRDIENYGGTADRLKGPCGEVRIDPDTQHCYQTPRIGRIQANGQFHIVWTGSEPVRPEPHPSSRTAEAWGVFLHDLYTGWGNGWAAPSARPAPK
jgi:hypothetical protein